jgi:hypothetical protein
MSLRIKPYFKGLGDHLQFSTLPELVSKTGETVDLHDEAIFSNDEIKWLVYSCNPYIKGKSSGSWDYGDGSKNWDYQHRHQSFIKNIESASGLIPENDNPKVYYEPKKIGNFDVVIDLGSVCLKDRLDYDKSKAEINNLLETTLKGSSPLIIKNKFYPSNNFLGFPEFEIESLKQYCDLISSSVNYISFLSGGHALAASLKHWDLDFDQYCIIPENLPGLNRGDEEGLSFFDYHIKKGFWTFPGVKYIKY